MKFGEIEYNMPKKAADDILSSRHGSEKNKSKQEYLCDYVNTQCGLLRKCVKVHVY